MNDQCVTYSINIRRKLLDVSSPCVMGILNITPDSFYTSISPDTSSTYSEIIKLTRKILDDGAKIIDIGGCSTRPGGEDVCEEKEWSRLSFALDIVKKEFPDCIVSVDTFRASIAERCIKDYDIHIINDISGGNDEMYDVVAKNGVSYILTFNESRNTFNDVCSHALWFFAERVQKLRDKGAKDIILDPGFGFNKTLDENYELLSNMENLIKLELPILVGISHKSMIYKLLDSTPAKTLNGTTILNTISLIKGANILRVHEVKEAVECIMLHEKILNARIIQ